MANKKPTGKKTGRPLKPIDWEAAGKLAGLHATGYEIAAFFGMHYDTFEKACRREQELSFTDWYGQNAADGKISLRRRQYSAAMTGNTALLIWLGKQWLGQSDKVEHQGSTDKPIMLAYKHEDL